MQTGPGRGPAGEEDGCRPEEEAIAFPSGKGDRAAVDEGRHQVRPGTAPHPSRASPGPPSRKEREILGYAVTDYEPSETVTYQDAEEQTISEEAYASLPATRFAGAEARTAYIGWLPDLHQEDLTLQLLQTSWEGSCTVK